MGQSPRELADGSGRADAVLGEEQTAPLSFTRNDCQAFGFEGVSRFPTGKKWWATLESNQA